MSLYLQHYYTVISWWAPHYLVILHSNMVELLRANSPGDLATWWILLCGFSLCATFLFDKIFCYVFFFVLVKTFSKYL